MAVRPMPPPISDLRQLLRHLQPVLNHGVVAICQVPSDADMTSVPWLGLFREAEGTTAIVREELAAARGWDVRLRAAWITLTVCSDLQAVGLTAAVAGALAAAGISCNVVAAANHDHVFVPFEKGEAALDVLRALQGDSVRQRQSVDPVRQG